MGEAMRIEGGYDQSNNVINENEVPNLSLYGEVSITRDSAADSIKSEDSSVRRKKHISRRLWARFDEEQKSNFQGDTINTSTTYFSFHVRSRAKTLKLKFKRF